MIRLFATSIILGVVAQPAAAQIASDNMTPRAPLVQTAVLRHELNDRLVAIRAIALSLQASDGGSLSAEHRAIIQAKIDRAQSDYERQLRRNNPWSVDANGSPIR